MSKKEVENQPEVVNVDELLSKLTKKNDDYIFDLKRKLQSSGKTELEITEILREILPVIVENQKKGISARKIFGTVSEYAASSSSTTSQVRGAENTTMWLMWLDSSLLLLGLLTIMNGAMMMFSKNAQKANYGLLSIVVMAASGGFVFYLMYQYFYRVEMTKKTRKEWIKAIVILIFAMFVWMLLFGLVSLLPKAINPNLNAVLALAIGAISLAVRWYLKKKYNIASAMMAQR
ncbi:MAG: DUF1129 domain-containing protein [Streptococcaceae bacterium]|nr:DUF1129 domain-containing protein [Streptococcaceae bacterium]